MFEIFVVPLFSWFIKMAWDPFFVKVQSVSTESPLEIYIAPPCLLAIFSLNETLFNSTPFDAKIAPPQLAVLFSKVVFEVLNFLELYIAPPVEALLFLNVAFDILAV